MAAKMAEAGALEAAKGALPLIDKETAQALTEAGIDPRKLSPDNPVHAAAIKAARGTVETGKIDFTALQERTKAEVRQEFGEGKTLAERIEQLRTPKEQGGQSDPARAQRLLDIQKEIKEHITINLPKTPPVEVIKDIQSTKLAARRLSRVVEKFDPTFVGILGKIKAISTKFSDLPGIPAFAERKVFANDLIAMTNDVKKTLLGAARSVPELADVARFLPDPDQNVSVAEFIGNFDSFLTSYLDIIDVLPQTLKELDLKTIDLTEERTHLVRALATLRAAQQGAGLGSARKEAEEFLRRKR